MRQRIWTCKGLVVREGRGFSFVKNHWPKSRELGSSKSFFWYVVFRSLNILYDSDVSYLSRGHNTPHLLSDGHATSISIVSVHRDGPTRPTFWGVGWIRPVVSTYSYSSCQCSHLLWQRLQSRAPPFPSIRLYVSSTTWPCLIVLITSTHSVFSLQQVFLSNPLSLSPSNHSVFYKLVNSFIPYLLMSVLRVKPFFDVYIFSSLTSKPNINLCNYI